MHTQSVSCLPKPPPSAPASYWWRFDLQLRCELLLSCERIGSQDLQTGGPLVVPFFFVVVQNETTLWISKIFNFLIVWRLFCFLSLSVSLFSLFFPSWIWFPSLLTWIEITPPDCNNFPPRWTPPVIGLNKQTNKQKPLPVTWTLSPDQSHGSKPSQMVLPLCICVSVCVCVSFLPSPSPLPTHPSLSPLPALWKANEESWAEGSFCVLVKKNNLCQRKVLQQLCCRTCSQKGWWDVVAGC